MIQSFKNKGLEELFNTGKSSKLPQERLKKLKLMLAVLNGAVQLKALPHLPSGSTDSRKPRWQVSGHWM